MNSPRQKVMGCRHKQTVLSMDVYFSQFIIKIHILRFISNKYDSFRSFARVSFSLILYTVLEPGLNSMKSVN